MTGPRAEVEVADGVLTAVRFVGDSSTPPFLHSSTLVGSPADLPAAGFAARARAAVSFGAEVGDWTFAEIGAAVRAAVGGVANPDRVGGFTGTDLDRLTAGWRTLDWRVITPRPLPPSLNLAVDEVLLDRVGRGHRPPTLRFWAWTESAVVLGRSQVLANEVDTTAAAECGVAVVRRISGGGAMYCTPDGVITYSLYLPEAAVAGLSIRDSYEVCDGWAVRALRGLGIDSHYIPVNDIGWMGGKIAGAAQARRAGGVLHHTTMAYKLDLAAMARVLRLGAARPAGRGVTSAAKVVSPLSEQTGLSRDAVVAELMRGFVARYGGAVDGLTTAELAAAEELVWAKYGADGWTRGSGS